MHQSLEMLRTYTVPDNVELSNQVEGSALSDEMSNEEYYRRCKPALSVGLDNIVSMGYYSSGNSPHNHAFCNKKSPKKAAKTDNTWIVYRRSRAGAHFGRWPYFESSWARIILTR